MEEYLRYGLLVIAGLIFIFMLVEGLLSRRRSKINIRNSSVVNKAVLMQDAIEPSCSIKPTAPQQTVEQAPVSPKLPREDDFLVLSVFAKPNMQFASYDLFQAISTTGLQFGEMNIFHYFHNLENKNIKLFSLASATKPGDFNLDRMGDFSCNGLTLFMDLRTVSHPELAFEIMLKTAEQLAEDLDGSLYAGHKKPWTEEALQQYQQTISQRKVLFSQ